MDERAMTQYLMRALRLAVAGGMPPGNALAAGVAVVGTMIGEVRDEAERQRWQDYAMQMLPWAVAYASNRRQQGSSMQ